MAGRLAGATVHEMTFQDATAPSRGGMRGAVLVAVTGEARARHACLIGAELARVTQAKLVLGIVAPERAFGAIQGQALPHGDVEQLARIRSRMLALGVAKDVSAAVEVVAAPSIAEGLARLVARRSPSVIVLDAHPPAVNCAGAVSAGADISRLLRHTSCPAVMVPAESLPPHVGTAEAVGIAWDCSREAAAALTAGLDLASKMGRPAKIIHSAAPARAGRATSTATLDPQAMSRAALARSISRVLAQRPATANISIELCDGLVADELAEASQRLHLLVIGARSQGTMRRLAPGRVAEHLAGHARCPVLVVPRGATMRVYPRQPARRAAPDIQATLVVRIDRLRKAMTALDEVIGRVPGGETVPLPMRLTRRDFASELATLERRRTTA